MLKFRIVNLIGPDFYITHNGNRVLLSYKFYEWNHSCMFEHRPHTEHVQLYTVHVQRVLKVKNKRMEFPLSRLLISRYI